jgi:hypothetical protein
MPAILEQYKQNSLFWWPGSRKFETTRPGTESEVGVAQKEKRPWQGLPMLKDTGARSLNGPNNGVLFFRCTDFT